MNQVSTQTVHEFASLRPSGGFRVILADPPWRYEVRSKKGAVRCADAHYTTMPGHEIASLPVSVLAADDCALFMWATWPLMPQWLPVLSSWGFEFSALAWEWVKRNPETGKYAFGGGYGTRKNLEPCLLATRGNPSLRKGRTADLLDEGYDPEGVRSVRDFIEWSPLDCIEARRREHSRKPPEQYERIETLFDGPYVELFARNTRPGWTSWGNEVGTFPPVEDPGK